MTAPQYSKSYVQAAILSESGQIDHKNDYVKDYNAAVHYGETSDAILENATPYSEAEVKKLIGDHTQGAVDFLHLPEHNHVICTTLISKKGKLHKIEYTKGKDKKQVILNPEQLERLTTRKGYEKP